MILAVLSRIPAWIWLVGVLGVWGLAGHWKNAQYLKEKAELAVEQQVLLRKTETQKQLQAQAVQDAYAKKLAESANRVSGLRSANQRLQSELTNRADTRDSAAVCGVDGERGRALETLLAEGSDLATEGAREIERLSAKTTALQDYIQRVCRGKE
jgi:hypothetical protein